MMDNMRLMLLGVASGIRDSVCGISAVIQLTCKPSPDPKKDEPSVAYRIWQCCLLNGGVCMASIMAFNYLMLPALWSLLTLLFGSSSGLAGTIWSWMRPVLVYLFSAVWVLPVFLLSRIVNMLWFQDIANSAYKQFRGRPQSLQKFSKLVADTLFSVFFQFMFLVQTMFVGLLPIPPIGYLMSLLHLSVLYGLYVFEYKWLNMGWEFHQRLSFIEHNWPYFVGFGLPLAVLTSISSSFIISACLFSIVFPLFIVSGHKATPVTGTCACHLPLFSPLVWFCNVALHQMTNSRARGLSAARHGGKPDAERQRRHDPSSERRGRDGRESSEPRTLSRNPQRAPRGYR